MKVSNSRLAYIDGGYGFIVPLIHDEHIIGFTILTSPRADTKLNWENLDLLKTAGVRRQVISPFMKPPRLWRMLNSLGIQPTLRFRGSRSEKSHSTAVTGCQKRGKT